MLKLYPWHNFFFGITKQGNECSPELGLLHLFTGPNLKFENEELIIYLILATKIITPYQWKILTISIEMQINKISSVATLEQIIDKVKNNKTSEAGMIILLDLDGCYGLPQ